jgi:hypothetical protein
MSETRTESATGEWLRELFQGLYNHSRAVGAFLLLTGWATAYWAERTLVRYAHMKASVLGLPQAFVLTFTLGFLGLIFVLAGRRAVDTFRRKGMGWMRYFAFLTVCLLLPAFLAALWTLHIRDELGVN